MREKDINTLLAALADSNEENRNEAVAALRHLRSSTVTLDEGLAIIAAARRHYPPTGQAFGSVSADLLWVIFSHARPEFIAPLVDAFPDFDRESQKMTFMTLSLIEEREAAEAIMALLGEVDMPGADSPLSDEIPLRPLERKPRHADVFFPAIFDHLGNPRLRRPILLLAQAYHEAGALPDDQLASALGQLLPRAYALLAEAKSFEQEDGTRWMWQESYSQVRQDMGMMLDLFARSGLPVTDGFLKEALTLRDPRLVWMIVNGMLRRNAAPPAAAIDKVAASLETRSLLYESIYETDWIRLFPERYLNQESLAASDMAFWLTYPTGLGYLPDALELMKVVAYRMGSDILDFFVFRFRVDDPGHPKTGTWLAGVSGPFSRRKEMRGRATGTFSHFDPYDEVPPEEHVNRLLNYLEQMATQSES